MVVATLDAVRATVTQWPAHDKAHADPVDDIVRCTTNPLDRRAFATD